MKSYQLKGSAAVVQAEPMTRGEYLKDRGLELAQGEGLDDAGMRVVVASGTVLWVPAAGFAKMCEEVCATPIRCAVVRFVRETAKLALAMFTVVFVMALTTCSSNEARIKDYRHLSGKIDALAEAQGLRFVEGEE